MAEHLTEEQLEGYRLRRMPVAELLAVDDHIAACEACRSQVSKATSDSLAVHLTVDPEHPQYEELVGFLDETLDDIERQVIESHLSGCSRCSADIGDLRAARSEITDHEYRPTRSTSRTTFWRRPIIWAPTYAVGLALIALVPIRNAQQRADALAAKVAKLQANSARLQELEQQAIALRSTNEDLRRQLSVKEAPRGGSVVASVTDNGHQIAIDASGKLQTDLHLPESLRPAMVAALSGKSFAMAANDLRGSAGILMGPSQEGVPFSLLTPVGTFVRDAKPVFTWQPVPQSESYLVEVYDENFRLLARSEPLTKSKWRPSAPLVPVSTYIWQVTATMKDGSKLTSPGSPAPEAKFRILDRESLSKVKNVAPAVSQSHLALGLLYARYGLLDEAKREFQVLARENPSSEEVKRLLDAVRRRTSK